MYTQQRRKQPRFVNRSYSKDPVDTTYIPKHCLIDWDEKIVNGKIYVSRGYYDPVKNIVVLQELQEFRR